MQSANFSLKQASSLIRGGCGGGGDSGPPSLDPPDPLSGFATVVRSHLLVLRRCNKLTLKAVLFVFKGDVTRNDSQRRFFDRATQRYNVVATLLRMVATLLQHCNAVLR